MINLSRSKTQQEMDFPGLYTGTVTARGTEDKDPTADVMARVNFS